MSSFASKTYKEIVTCDEEAGTVLRMPTTPIKAEDWDIVRTTADKLLYIRNEVLKGGAGLAAPQIGLNLPIFLYTPDRTTANLRVVINPSFEAIGDEFIEGAEACFSEPLRCVTLRRWKRIKVRYQTLDQNWVETILEDFAAKVFQHEMDHIQGHLTMDHPDAHVLSFTDPKAFEEHMKQVHQEDAKTYPKG